jgi:hypothetical protein
VNLDVVPDLEQMKSGGLTERVSSKSISIIRKILCNRCPATRCESNELEIIYTFLTTHTKISQDPLWAFLPRDQRVALCAYFRYVRQDGSELIDLKPLTSSGCSAQDSKLYLLLQGTVELTCGNHSIILNGSFGHCLGSLFLPPSVRALMKGTSSKTIQPSDQVGNDSTDSFSYSAYFDTVHKSQGRTCSQGPNRPILSVGKGCHYIYLCSIECGHHLKVVFDRLVASWIFHRLDFKFPKITKGDETNYDDLPARSNFGKGHEIHFIPQGHLLFKEGFDSRKIALTLRGKCQLTKQSCDQNGIEIKISHAGPMSFLGFVPHCIQNGKHQAMKGRQPFTIVTSTKVSLVLLDAEEFKKSLTDSSKRAFDELAKRQIDWLLNKFPKRLARQKLMSQKAKTLGRDDQYIESLPEDFPSSTMVDMEEIILFTRVIKNPRLNKRRILKGFESRLNGEEGDEESVEYEEDQDPFRRFDFINTTMYNLNKDIEMDWSGQDNFKIDYDIDNEQDLVGGIQCHNFEQPFPSILLSRKSFGKTLPQIPQSKGFLNPFST